VSYLVGTPKGKLTSLEAELTQRSWQQARPSVRVKLLPQDGGEAYVFVHSAARVAKERAMRQRRLRQYLARLKELQKRKRPLKRDALHQALGAARKAAGRDARHLQVEVQLHGAGQAQRATLNWQLNRKTLRTARSREGRYLLRTNLTETDPGKLWEYYLQLTEVEQAFKELKGDLAVRPIFHQLEHRVEAHIFIAFLAYGLQVTLKARLKPLANGLTPRAVLEKFAAMQMLDVHLPTTDDRAIVLTRYTQPEKDLQLLLDQLKLILPEQAPPKIQKVR
jgi:transposase